ncbi:MAG: preprotein translocase subunit SecG [Candidatus Ryanbacteria bacterium]|nr:preprotein translocase subunit SecG [Candidatus Ryanbacteria bacterium]
MQNALPIIQIVLSFVLGALVLLQQRGESLGSAFGGDSASYTSRRGMEKTIFISTIIVAILFFASAVVALILR